MTHQTANVTPQVFTKLRRMLWPIHRDELKKFLPMTLMMFFMLFNYTTLRNIKDSLIVTDAGPEAIPFLKAIILPFSILFVTAYAKFSNTVSRERLFYIILGTFLAMYMAYILVLYPHRATYHLDPQTILDLKAAYPNIQHIFPLIGCWSTTLFYLAAELWGAIVIILLFWQFANETTEIHQARRFYSMFGLLSHFALIGAGWTGNYFWQLNKIDHHHDVFIYSGYVIIVNGLIIMAIYRWINVKVLGTKDASDQDQVLSQKPIKTKLSLKESFKYILSSKYLGFIALLVLGYGLCINLTGIMWKKQVQMQFPKAEDYFNFMSSFAMWVGYITIALIFFLKNTVERFGWYKGAMVTPIMLLMTAVPFFAFMFFSEQTQGLVAWMGTTPLMSAVIIGGAQQILSKSAKYSMFDPTKEMAYIPLDTELKVKGKAAVDVTGYSFAKACGGYISGGLLVILAAADLMVIAPYLAIIVIAMIVIWCFAVKRLSQMYYGLINSKA